MKATHLMNRTGGTRYPENVPVVLAALAAASVSLNADVNPVGPRPAFVSADFRREAETLTTHNGEQYYVAVCSELIEGRWEGFTTMRRAK
jgi:hypothetical protein